MPLRLDLTEDKTIVDETFSIYNVYINGTSIDFYTPESNVEFDCDGVAILT